MRAKYCSGLWSPRNSTVKALVSFMIKKRISSSFHNSWHEKKRDKSKNIKRIRSGGLLSVVFVQERWVPVTPIQLPPKFCLPSPRHTRSVSNPLRDDRGWGREGFTMKWHQETQDLCPCQFYAVDQRVVKSLNALFTVDVSKWARLLIPCVFSLCSLQKIKCIRLKVYLEL
jgi:hypothetical protein